jgi:hypothetical protein
MRFQIQAILDFSKQSKFDSLRINISYFRLNTLLEELKIIFQTTCE